MFEISFQVLNGLLSAKNSFFFFFKKKERVKGKAAAIYLPQ
jgi:hypothetical protein